MDPVTPIKTKLRLRAQQRLFYTPLVSFYVDGHEELNDRLMADIAGWQAQSAGIQSSNRHGWHSERTFFDRKEDSFVELGRHIRHALASTAKGLNPKLDDTQRMLLQGWVNVNEQGAYNSPHDHPDYQLSGCYYVRVPTPSPDSTARNSGNIEFIDPRGQALVAQNDKLIVASSKYAVRPKPGLMLIFPSNLMHWVYPFEESEPRVSIAFNVLLTAARKSG